MSDPTHLLIPFAAGHFPAAPEALQRLHLPKLSALLGRLRPGPLDPVDELSPETPHERALARCLGLEAGAGRTPWAAHQLRQSGGDPGLEAWAWITPCHWQASMGRVVLPDPAELNLQEGPARELHAAMAPYFAEDGLELRFEAPGRWLARGELFRGLITASIDRVSGRDVGAWMPQAVEARHLHRLQTEMQMLLYTHPVNDARAELGLAPVNSFWVSGAGALQADAPVPTRPPVVETALRDAALRQDGAAWSQAWQQVDATQIAALLAELERGQAVRLTLCGEQASRTWETVPDGFLQRISRLFGSKPAPYHLSSL